MVSYSKRNHPRPLWIVKIHKRYSFDTFKKHVSHFEEKGDINWVLKGPQTKTVYKVTVETMENCGTEQGQQDIFVTEEMAKATGEMLDNFEDEVFENPSLDDSSFFDPDEEEKDYEDLRNSKELDPYESDSDDDDDESFWKLTDLEEAEKSKDGNNA